MSKQANTTLIGGFVVGAIALVVAGVIIFGSGRLLSQNMKFVLFFDESVKGLNIGAPVDFKGVTVGSVTDVQILLDPKDTSLAIPVYIKMDPDKVNVAQRNAPIAEMIPLKGSGVVIAKLVEGGLKAQLVTQSFVTGQLGVHLDFHPDKPVKLVGDHKNTPEIPTIRSSFAEITSTLENIPIAEIANKLLKTIDGLEKLVNSPGVMEAVANINQTSKDAQKLLQNVDSQVQPLATSVQTTLVDTQRFIRELNESVKPLASSFGQGAKDAGDLMRDIKARIPLLVSRMDETLKTATAAMEQADKSIHGIAGQNSAVRFELVRALNEFTTAARSIRIMADQLERHPESLIRGKTR